MTMSKDAETPQEGHPNEVEQETIQDIARYSTKTFVTWKCFMIQEKTVWRSSKLWLMMGYLTAISLVVAIATLVIVPNPSVLKVGKFTDVSKFLNVVVGLLLGFFMSSSMNRWFTCVDGFLQLLDAIRNLQLQFIGLGVPNVELGLCMRYGLLSGWLMYFSLLDDADNTGPEDESTDHMDMVITKLQEQSKKWRHQGKGLGEPQALKEQSFSLDLTEAERSALKKTHDPAAMVWVWVAGLIGRLAQDGFIPPMASPTYGRIMNLCQQAHSGIRDIAGSMKVQPPLIYTHMLATLVHVNNILNAVTFGMVLGLSVGTVLQFTDMHPFWPRDTNGNLETLMKESQRDGQTAVVTFMYCFLGPSIYQAFLLIGMELAQPFDSEEAKIPLHRFLLSLERDLQDGSMIANQMCFDKPCFKPPSRASAEIAPEELRRASICWSTAPAEP